MAVVPSVENLKLLTTQQFVMMASGTLMVSAVLLSHDNPLGYVLLLLALACGTGAFLKSRHKSS